MSARFDPAAVRRFLATACFQEPTGEQALTATNCGWGLFQESLAQESHSNQPGLMVSLGAGGSSCFSAASATGDAAAWMMPTESSRDQRQLTHSCAFFLCSDWITGCSVVFLRFGSPYSGQDWVSLLSGPIFLACGWAIKVWPKEPKSLRKLLVFICCFPFLVLPSPWLSHQGPWIGGCLLKEVGGGIPGSTSIGFSKQGAIRVLGA